MGGHAPVYHPGNTERDLTRSYVHLPFKEFQSNGEGQAWKRISPTYCGFNAWK